MSRHDKTLTQKFIQAQMKKEMPKNYEILPTHYINTTNPEVQAPKTFRRNRFEIAQEDTLTARKAAESK